VNSWRRPGQGNRPNQDRSSSGTNTPTKDGGRPQPVSAASGNAWGGKGKAAGSAQAAQTSAPAENHVPVRDFNANEVRDFLKRSTSDKPKQQPVREQSNPPAQACSLQKNKANHLIEYLESTAGTLPSPSTHQSNVQADAPVPDQPAVYHKVQGDSVAKRSSGAWGSRGTWP
jgi:hypothetical protein